MFRFILSRLLWVALVLFGVSLVAFFLIHSIPGNPWYAELSSQRRAMLSHYLDPISIKLLNRQFGLDKPVWQQYIIYVFGGVDQDGKPFCGAICGNLGPSLHQRGRSVQSIIFFSPEEKGFWYSRFGYSARLAMYSFLFTAWVGILLGIAMAIAQGSAFDRIASALITLTLSIPSFVFGILLIIILASWLKLVKIVPVWEDPRAWIMPVFVLSVVPTAMLARLTRASVCMAMQGDFVRTARAKGGRKLRVVFRHVLPNAAIPIATALAPVMVELVAASFIVESLFGFPGIGRGYWQAVVSMDYPVMMGLTLLYSLGMVTANILAEALYGVLDPRIRSSNP